jgi:hypothetical protein
MTETYSVYCGGGGGIEYRVHGITKATNDENVSLNYFVNVSYFTNSSLIEPQVANNTSFGGRVVRQLKLLVGGSYEFHDVFTILWPGGFLLTNANQPESDATNLIWMQMDQDPTNCWGIVTRLQNNYLQGQGNIQSYLPLLKCGTCCSLSAWRPHDKTFIVLFKITYQHLVFQFHCRS